MINMGIGLSIATGAVVARALGQKDQQQTTLWISSSFYLAILIALILMTIGLTFQDTIFQLLGAGPELLPLISAYMTWWFAGSVLLIILIVVNASVRATGNTKLPSLVMLFSALLNGILDPLLIFGIGPFPELGIQGAAIATLISWLLALLLIMRFMIRNQLISFGLNTDFINSWKKLVSLGVPAAFTNMLGPLANGLLVAWVAQYGTTAIAAYGVGSRLEPLALIVVMAFTASLPPFVGQNHGAGEHKRIEEALVKSMQFIMIWQLLVYAAMAIMAEPISLLFSDDANVREVIKTFIYILPISYFGLGFSLVTTATINSLHKPRISLLINALRLFIFYIPLAWIGNHYWGLTGLFWGCAMANLMVGLTVMLLFNKVRNHQGLRNKLLEV